MAGLNLSKEEIKAIAIRGYENPLFFLKFFLEKWFPKEVPWVHRGIVAILTRRCDFLLEFDEHYTEACLDKIIRHFTWREDPTDDTSKLHYVFELDYKGKLHMTLGKFTLIMMPRGFSKTTLINGVNIWYTCYQESKFFAYLSETGAHASRQLSNVALHLATNPRIKLVFGNLKPKQRGGSEEEASLKWSESDGMIQTTTGITFLAKGRGGQIRGQNVDADRPDRLIIDDVEDKESVKTDEQRLKAREWFFGDVLPALPELNDDATAVMMGTLLHSDALLTYAEIDPEWTTIKFGAIDLDGDPLWAENLTLEKIERKKISYAAKGLLHIFYLEYFNQIRNPEKALFKPEYIHIAPVSIQKLKWKAMCVDPAISPKRRADYVGFGVVAMNDDGIIQVAEAFGKKGMSPREQVDMYFNLHRKFGLTSGDKHGVESVAYQAALIHLIKEEMFRQAKKYGPSSYFEITPVTHGTKKDERIEGVLQPRYAAGYIHHQRKFPLYETMLLDWPNGKKDIPDVIAMAITLLDDVAGVAAGDSGSESDEDQYEDLSEIFGGDWRSY